MLSLIAKDFKLLFQGSSKNKMSQVLGLLFTIMAGAIFIVIEVFLFDAIFRNLKKINQATDAYFSLFLFVIGAGLTSYGIFHWSMLGSFVLVLLFLGSSIFQEGVSSSKYPEYQIYCPFAFTVLKSIYLSFAIFDHIILCQIYNVKYNILPIQTLTFFRFKPSHSSDQKLTFLPI